MDYGFTQIAEPGNPTAFNFIQHTSSAINLYRCYGSGYYTTASHTDENPRFRILFRLDKPITKADTLVLLYKALIRYYGTEVADKTCKDSCRMFFGSVNAKH